VSIDESMYKQHPDHLGLLVEKNSYVPILTPIKEMTAKLKKEKHKPPLAASA